jgi:hypothetical protein
MLTGCTLFFANGTGFALSCKSRKFEKRGINEPETEKNVRGSHEGFVETINTNMAILRRKIKNNNLKFKTMKIGATTEQTVAIAYIKDIANPELLETLYGKIKNINYDGILANGYIEQMITDFPNSPFPQYQATERPDKVVSAMLDGRFAIILEGTPVVLIVPTTLFSLFQTTDDYSTNWMFGSYLTSIRVVGAIAAMFFPAFYIAVTMYHYYVVPLNLLVPLAESRSRVPFPPIIEALIMEITIEMLREAAIRLPTYIGASIGIVGGIVIGQAAVQAGIVSDVLVVIVAVTAIGSYVIPNYDLGLAVRFLRFGIMILASIFGIIGILISAVMLYAHLTVIESLGQPYLQPLVPFWPKDAGDVVFRLPFKYLMKRPELAKPLDKRRGKSNE